LQERGSLDRAGHIPEELQRAIAEIEKFPFEEQDAFATGILAGLADDQARAACFDATTDEQRDRFTEVVRRVVQRATGRPL
tara:strand:- start:103 stop:345 length:243 start_codon:yes stop_codon:yes gene_type:complete